MTHEKKKKNPQNAKQTSSITGALQKQMEISATRILGDAAQRLPRLRAHTSCQNMNGGVCAGLLLLFLPHCATLHLQTVFVL